jgi:exonuclease III
MRILTWNVRRAAASSPVWDYLCELAPDVALLQEVGAISPRASEQFGAVLRRATGKTGRLQRFCTGILVRGEIREAVNFSTEWVWVDRELALFDGNIVANRVMLTDGQRLSVVSAYSPAWPVPPERLVDADVTQLKLANSSHLWVTELLYAALSSIPTLRDDPWIIGGDLNASETFDYLWPGGPRGNRELLDRLVDLGLVEALRHTNGGLVPTFRNARGGRVVHQMDHLFLSPPLAKRLESCSCGDAQRVFGDSLSDHLPVLATLR